MPINFRGLTWLELVEACELADRLATRATDSLLAKDAQIMDLKKERQVLTRRIRDLERRSVDPGVHEALNEEITRLEESIKDIEEAHARSIDSHRVHEADLGDKLKVAEEKCEAMMYVCQLLEELRNLRGPHA